MGRFRLRAVSTSMSLPNQLYSCLFLVKGVQIRKVSPRPAARPLPAAAGLGFVRKYAACFLWVKSEESVRRECGVGRLRR